MSEEPTVVISKKEYIRLLQIEKEAEKYVHYFEIMKYPNEANTYPYMLKEALKKNGQKEDR
jgi:hypothetical protein